MSKQLLTAAAGEDALRTVGALSATTLPVTDVAAIENGLLRLEISLLRRGITIACTALVEAGKAASRYPRDAERLQKVALSTLEAAQGTEQAADRQALLDSRVDTLEAVTGRIAPGHRSCLTGLVGACPTCGGDFYRQATAGPWHHEAGTVAGVVDICQDCGHTQNVEEQR